MQGPEALRIAVVGAGMAGLACAGALHRAGAVVSVFDKGRRVGGRLATRRVDGLQFDHGAQYATARDTAFAAVLRDMQAAGDAALWQAAGEGRWAGTPGMSALAQHMQRRGVGTLHTGRHVAFLRRTPQGWMLRHLDATAAAPGFVADEGEVAGPFDRVAVALPAPQAAGLLRPHRFADDAVRAGIAPCWALMLAFAEPSSAHDIPQPDVLQPGSGPFAWIARDSSRPGRDAAPECWVAHATAEWSRAMLEQPAPAVLDALRAAFALATGIDAAPLHAAVHRWRYALVDAPLGTSALWDAEAGLGVCGDWCLGARVESAFLSGQALAAAMVPGDNS